MFKANNNLENAEKDLKTTKEKYQSKINSKLNDIENLKQQLIINKEKLDETVRWATKEKIKLAKNDITQKEISLTNTKKKIEKFELRAPFTGIVRKIDLKVWDNIVSDEDKFIYIENPDLLEISILLDQVDIAKVTSWLPVKINFDAYPNNVFEWEISEIDTTPIEQSGVVSYQAKIIIQKSKKQIYSWMTASVTIIINQKSNIILIPIWTIQGKWRRKTVQLIDMLRNNDLISGFI